MSLLHVPSFGGGVVRLGSPNIQRTDELLAADSLDIGPRGQLVATTDVSDYLELKDLQGARAAWTMLLGLDTISFIGLSFGLAVGVGKSAIANDVHLVAYFLRSGETTPIPIGKVYQVEAVAIGVSPYELLVTVVQFPGVANGEQVALINMGGIDQDWTLSAAPGLYVLKCTVATGVVTLHTISEFDSLSDHNGAATTQLKFRGIAGYNNHVFGWGYDASDATHKSGPARVMFCNAGNPLKWGNDNVGVAAGRAFTDSDAIVLGDAGEIVRAGLKWNGRLWFGTNRELHYIAGFGRNSFLTDGANPVAKSHNVVGPHAMIEGPDRLLYGVADQGLWAFDGSTFEPHWRKLVDFHGHSTGWWDLIITANRYAVWMAVDWDREQVLVGIPFCSASNGYGTGSDTVVIKFHVRTGGFTRQVFTGVAYSAAAYARREGSEREVRFLGTATAGQTAVKRFGYQTTPTTSPVMPTALPLVTFGPYLPFGPDGEGVVRRVYLTLSWEAVGSLPLVFTVTTAADESTTETRTLRIGATAAGAPVAGDLWLDTSQSDTNLGNNTAGTLVAALAGYLMKTYSGTAWLSVPGSGAVGTRATIPMPMVRRKATRATVSVQCTSAAGRFQIEDLGLDPGGGKAAL